MSNILLVHPCAQIFNIPCVVNLINMMGNMGSRVFFPVIKNDLFEESRVSLSDGIEVLGFPFLQRSRKESFVIWFLGYLTFCFLVARKNRPDVIVAMGSKGLIIGAFLSYFWSARLCFYSLEFPAYPPRTVKDKLHLIVERILSRYVDILVIHDENRLKLYEKIVSRIFDDFIIFPNAPIETPSEGTYVSEVREAYGISRDQKVILYSGGLYPGIGLEKLCDEVEALGTSWTLFLQSHDGVSELGLNKKVAQLVEQGRVIINIRPLATSHYAALLKICSIGVAYYSSEDENMYNVGLSSGKIAAYWKNGMPVIVNDLPVIRDILNEFSCGVISNSFEDISDAVAIIDRSRDEFTEGAFFAYAKYFSLENVEPQLKDMLFKNR